MKIILCMKPRLSSGSYPFQAKSLRAISCNDIDVKDTETCRRMREHWKIACGQRNAGESRAEGFEQEMKRVRLLLPLIVWIIISVTASYGRAHEHVTASLPCSSVAGEREFSRNLEMELPSLAKSADEDIQNYRPMKLDFTASYVSRYMWRGIDLNNGYPMLEPIAKLIFEKSGYSFMIQGYYGLQGTDVNNEMDFVLRRDFRLNRHFSMNVNLAYYEVPHQSCASYPEAWAQLVWDNAPLKPAFSFYKEIRPLGTDYFNLQLTQTVNCGKIPLTFGLSAGYQYGQRIPKDGFTDMELSLAMDWINKEKFSTNTRVAYNLVPNNPTVSTNNIVWYSVNARFTW
jgi:hypothetical protein